MTAALEGEIAAKVSLPDDQLYKLFAEDEGALFNEEGRTIEGKRRFHALLTRHKAAVCDAYRKFGADISDGVAVAVGLANFLSKELREAGFPLAPFCILAVRHGLNRFCAATETTGDA